MRAAGSTHLISLGFKARMEKDKKITIMVAIMVRNGCWREKVWILISDHLLPGDLGAVRLHVPGGDSGVRLTVPKDGEFKFSYLQISTNIQAILLSSRQDFFLCLFFLIFIF